MKINAQYCLFYRITVTIQTTWFVVGIFRNEDHLAFERTNEEDNSQLDFFVPEACKDDFLGIVSALHAQGHILSYQQLTNPLIPL